MIPGVVASAAELDSGGGPPPGSVPLARAGQFTRATTTSPSTSVTGLGFQPKAIIFFGSAATVTANDSGSAMAGWIGFHGFSDGTTTRSFSMRTVDGAATASAAKGYWSKLSGNNSSATPAELLGGTITFTADGFDVAWSIDGLTATVNYLAIGGDDVTAKVVEFQHNWATGGAVTGVGFQPEAVLWSTVLATSTPPYTVRTTSQLSLGMYDGTTQVGVGIAVNDGNSSSDNSTASTLTRGMIVANTNATTARRAAFSSLDSDGFTIAAAEVGTGTFYEAVLCLAGATFEVATLTKDTTSGAHTATLPVPAGGDIVGALAVSLLADGTTENVNHVRYGIGAFDDDLNQRVQAHWGSDAASDMVEKTFLSNTSGIGAPAGSTTWTHRGAVTAINGAAGQIDVSWGMSGTVADRIHLLLIRAA